MLFVFVSVMLSPVITDLLIIVVGRLFVKENLSSL